jgi:hypothetical protein
LFFLGQEERTPPDLHASLSARADLDRIDSAAPQLEREEGQRAGLELEGGREEELAKREITR